MERAREIIRNLLAETTFPGREPGICRTCECLPTVGYTSDHHPECPWLLAVTEAKAFLNENP